jgi:hypothetical protein
MDSADFVSAAVLSARLAGEAQKKPQRPAAGSNSAHECGNRDKNKWL